MHIHIEAGDIHRADLETRMPFKYGIATMTRTPHLFLRLRVVVDGHVAQPMTGIAADHLPPKWFTKDPARPIAEETHEMLRVVENALRLAVGVRADSPFEAWLAVHQQQSSWGVHEGLPPLLTQFGTALVERAVIEAVCRAVGRPFWQLLQENRLGIRLDAIHPDLASEGCQPPVFQPRTRIIARHTVGLADPLCDADIAPADRLDDGLPQSLEACIRAYDLRHFKIKVSGSVGQDRERLLRVAETIRSNAAEDFAFSLDGNEQFRSAEQFREYWEGLSPAFAWFFTHLLFVEQPFHRDVALSEAASATWTDRPPIIIDESDAELDSLPRALRLGYAGTSHKNCKGVFKSVANLCLLARLRHEQPASPRRTFILSGEDLANIGPVALLQDLTVCATLGIASVERNGHHYFAGLSMWPDDVQRKVLEQHGDLYRASRDGWPTLKISDGFVDVGSLLQAPFGVGFAMPVESFMTPEQWRRANPI